MFYTSGLTHVDVRSTEIKNERGLEMDTRNWEDQEWGGTEHKREEFLWAVREECVCAVYVDC